MDDKYFYPNKEIAEANKEAGSWEPTENDVATQWALIGIRDNIRYAFEGGATVAEVGDAIIDGLAGQKRQWLNQIALALELNK